MRAKRFAPRRLMENSPRNTKPRLGGGAGPRQAGEYRIAWQLRYSPKSRFESSPSFLGSKPTKWVIRVELRWCESPGNAARIAALSDDQAPTAITGCPHMTLTPQSRSESAGSRWQRPRRHRRPRAAQSRAASIARTSACIIRRVHGITIVSIWTMRWESAGFAQKQKPSRRDGEKPGASDRDDTDAARAVVGFPIRI